jgi:hypothetical protein
MTQGHRNRQFTIRVEEQFLNGNEMTIQLLIHEKEWMIRPEPFLSVSGMLAD